MLSRLPIRCLAMLAVAWGAIGGVGADEMGARYAVEAWSSRDGLPQDSVYAIAQTPDGYLWLGTAAGLARFDGARFTVFDSGNTEALANHFIRDLVTISDSLWIGTDGGLISLRDGAFKRYSRTDGLPHDRVMILEPGGDGSLWIGTYGGGLARLKDGVFRTYTEADGLRGLSIFALCEDRGGTLWVGSLTGGLQRLRDDRFEHLTVADGRLGDSIYALAEDSEGRLWVSSEVGLSVFRDGRILSLAAASPPLAWVNDFLPGVDGEMWLATDGGLRRFSDGAFSVFPNDGAMRQEKLFDIFRDERGSVWVGTSVSGVHRIRESSFRVLLPERRAQWVYEEADGTLWLSTPHGLHRRQAGTSRLFTTADGLADNLVWSAIGDDEGVWIGTNAGLQRWADGSFTDFTVADGLPHPAVFSVLVDHKGAVWAGTNGGLGRYHDGVWTTLTSADGLAADQIRSLHEDQAGRLWIGTTGGLSCLEDGRITTLTMADGPGDFSHPKKRAQTPRRRPDIEPDRGPLRSRRRHDQQHVYQPPCEDRDAARRSFGVSHHQRLRHRRSTTGGARRAAAFGEDREPGRRRPGDRPQPADRRRVGQQGF
jgi:ligand-binding sensor domain-containing protein